MFLESTQLRSRAGHSVGQLAVEGGASDRGVGVVFNLTVAATQTGQETAKLSWRSGI